MHARPGSVLVMALLIVGALFFLALAATNLFRSEAALGAQAERAIKASAAATAGIEECLAILSQTPDWTTGLEGLQPQAGARYTVTFDRTRSDVPYSTNNSQGAGMVVGTGGRQVPPGGIHLVSVGRFEGQTRQEEALLTAPGFPYGYGMFGHEAGVVLGADNLVDSYDAKAGPYSETVRTVGGNIGTNSTISGRIGLGAGTVVNGDVRVGPGGNRSVVKGSGDYQSLVVPLDAYPVNSVASPFQINKTNVAFSGRRLVPPGAYQDLKPAKNATLVLQAGDYVFRRFDGGDNVTIELASKPVNLYFTEFVRLGRDSKVNVGGLPEDLNFHGANGTKAREFRAWDRSVVQATVEAPNAIVVLNKQVEFFGSVLAQGVQTQDGVKIHYNIQLETQVTRFGILSRW